MYKIEVKQKEVENPNIPDREFILDVNENGFQLRDKNTGYWLVDAQSFRLDGKVKLWTSCYMLHMKEVSKDSDTVRYEFEERAD